MTGKTLAHYQVTEKLGAGGMGEVYRARDTRLNRDVALKFLPAHFAQDPERLARFEREAQVLAQLNHQNIAAIYGFEHDKQECLCYLVLEYVPGETLPGPVPLEDLPAVLAQLIAALEEAHENGIVHRDLKPANIKITPEGKLKVLDFGLAKALADEGSSNASANSPTLAASALTRGGMLLGTAAYMSPEQARGKRLDKRSDIFAFGSVLYEMLTGKQAFGGETISDSLGAILLKEPDRGLLPETTPAGLRRLLDRCLEKDPQRRLRDIGEARIILEETPLEEPLPPAVIPTPPPDRPGGLSHRLPWAAAPLAALAAGLAVWLLARPPKPAPRPVARLTMTLPARFDFRGTQLALSPDGAHLAFLAGSPRQLYIRQMDQSEAKLVLGTEEAGGPFFSPDGRWVGFRHQSKLKKVPVTGGASITLCDTEPFTFGASWGADGTIVFASGTTAGLSRVSAAGGKPEALTRLDKGEISHRAPQVLPGGRAVLFTAGVEGQASWDDARIVLLALDSGQKRVLAEGGTYARYVPTGGPDTPAGHLVYWRAGSLFAVPFDLGKLQVTGSASPILEGVFGISPFGHVDFGFSDIGMLAYTPGGPASQGASTLAWVDRQGKVEPIPAPPRAYGSLRLSPDGQRVAVEIGAPGAAASDIWVYEFARGTATRLTFQGRNTEPLWTPDGKRVTFATAAEGKAGLAWVAADGSGAVENLASLEKPSAPFSWSPDGRILSFGLGVIADRDIWILPAAGQPSGAPTGPGERKPRPFLETRFSIYYARSSPDGRWIAYSSNESGQAQVFVQPAPGPEGKAQGSGKWQISNDGGVYPRWSSSGRELFYLGGQSMFGGKLMVAAIDPGPAFRAAVPQPLFDLRLAVRAAFDVAPDGKRFLVVQAPGQELAAAQPVQLNFVLEWFEEIRRRTAAGK